MKLLARFNVIFLLVFGLGLSVTVWLADIFLRNEARARVLDQAKLMMETTIATRTYTTEQVKPLLVKQQRHDSKFLPQTVPAFSAIAVFDYLHQRNPDYAYKEATLNPTNPRDRAADWEADVVNTFRNNKDQKDVVGERDTPTGRALFYAHPLRVTTSTCLECHSTAATAPVSMIRQYGPDNGFGWHLNDIIGAQIVSVPESVPLQMADTALKTLLLYLVVIAVITLLILDAVLVVTVIRPVARLSQMADKISQGKLDVEDLPVKGRDEISLLAASFNRMQRSLSRAMKMLESDKD
jgi:HAMP domain-containing protein